MANKNVGIFEGVNLFINKREWLEYTPEEMAIYQDRLFRYYRQLGFPYFPTTDEFRLKEFRKMKKYDFRTIIEGDIVRQTMHGLSLAWSFMPHAVNVRCRKFKTPLEVFNSDKDLKGAIAKRLKMGDNMSHNGLRKMIKIYTGAQSVSNFRPTAAAAIYDKYAPSGIVWDMSSGFGGRLLGSIISNVRYIGTDPASVTFGGLCQMRDMFTDKINVQLHKMGSEEFIPDRKSLDLCFTSPPYFNLEQYSDEDTQSYVKHSTKRKWLDDFLGKTFQRCHYGLKDGKKMIINIANTKDFSDLEEETVKVAKNNGFKLEGTLKLALSNPNFKTKKCAFKYEPVFVFKKR